MKRQDEIPVLALVPTEELMAEMVQRSDDVIVIQHKVIGPNGDGETPFRFICSSDIKRVAHMCAYVHAYLCSQLLKAGHLPPPDSFEDFPPTITEEQDDEDEDY